jgi:hypothetical protein
MGTNVKLKTIGEASLEVGGLSNPSKMPCRSWSTPAEQCRVGSKLRGIPGSVCESCYATKGCYGFKSTREAMARRFETLGKDWEAWVANFVVIMRNKPHFRWHDSGDVQGLDHLEAIAEIARKSPQTSFWLPTKEYGTVRAFLRKYGEFPDNLTVRVSAPMIGQRPDSRHMPDGTVGSAVGCDDAWQCPAPSQDGECGDCRACWDRTVPVVSYKIH